MAKSPAANRDRAISWPVILFLVGLIIAVLWWVGQDYYRLSLADQAYHPDHKELRSSGLLGYGYGVAGTFLIFANLLYLGRRRLAKWKLGSMRAWLDIHVFTGLAGAAFILFHSAFKARSTIAQVTVWSLVVVIITGLVGRFLFALVPKRDAKALSKAIDAVEAAVPGTKEQIEVVLRAHPITRSRMGLLGAIAALGPLRKTAAARRQSIMVITGNSGVDAALSRAVIKEAVREVDVVSKAQLLRTWRALHRFFAILMLLTVVAHIGIAWYYGYRWIFSQ